MVKADGFVLKNKRMEGKFSGESGLEKGFPRRMQIPACE
jgi:hypothetical protein